MHEFYIFLTNAYNNRVQSWQRQHLLISYVLDEILASLTLNSHNIIDTIHFAAPQIVRLLLSYSDVTSDAEQPDREGSAASHDTGPGPGTPRPDYMTPTLPYQSLDKRAHYELMRFVCHVSAHSEKLALRLALEVRKLAENCHRAISAKLQSRNPSWFSCWNGTPTECSLDLQAMLFKYGTLMSMLLNIVIAVGTSSGAHSSPTQSVDCDEVCSSTCFFELFQLRYPVSAICAIVHIPADSPQEQLFQLRTSHLFKLIKLVDILRDANTELNRDLQSRKRHGTLVADYTSHIEAIHAEVAGEHLYLPGTNSCEVCGTPRVLAGVRLNEGRAFSSPNGTPILVMFDCPALDEGFCDACSYSQALKATYVPPDINISVAARHISLRCKGSVTGMPLVEETNNNGPMCEDSPHSGHSSLSHSTNRSRHTENSDGDDENDVDIRHSNRRSMRRDSWHDLTDVENMDEAKSPSDNLSTRSDAATLDRAAVRTKHFSASRNSTKFAPVVASIDAVGVLSKSGERIGMEQLISQMLRLYQHAFDDAAITVHHPNAITRQHNFKSLLTSYMIVETSPNAGLAEFLPNVKSLHEIKSIPRSDCLPCGSCMCCFRGECCPGSGISLCEYFLNVYGKDREHQPAAHNAARLNFVRSLAPNLVTQYLLAIKDRHNGNIMLHNDGRLIHVDFAFSLGSKPGGNRNPEQNCYITPEILDMLDGYLTLTEDGSRVECMAYFKWLLWRCFLGARSNRMFMENWIQLSQTTGIVADSSDETVQHILHGFRQRHWLELEDYQLTPEYIYAHLVEPSVASSTYCGNFIDCYGLYQKARNGILR